MEQNHVDIDDEKDKAMVEALQKAEARHTRELQAALTRLEDQLEKDKDLALAHQKQVCVSC